MIMYHEIKEEITNQKKLFIVQKITWQRKTRGLHFFLFYWFGTVFVGWVISFIFFSLLTINHKHKCIQAKTFKTQASWSLHSSLHFSYNDEEKVKKNIKWYNNATISCLPLIFKNIFILFVCGIWHQMKLCAWRFKKKEQRNFNNK